MKRLSVLALAACVIVSGGALAAETTHEQAATLAIPTGEEKVTIHTFCVDAKGRLLAACGGEQMSYVRGEKGYELKTTTQSSGIRVLSPEGKLLTTWPLEITPQSVNVGPDGSVYCGGQGRLAKLDANGKVLKTADSPQVTELGPLPSIDVAPAPKLSAEEQKAKDEKIATLQKQRTEALAEYRKVYQERKAKAADEQAKAQLDAQLETALNHYRQVAEELRALATDPQKTAMQKRYAAMRKRKVSAIAVTKTDLFVACPAAKGYGYDIWRLDLELASPRKIVTGLRGCCGQMDIQAAGGKVYAAENARKRVVAYDREGKQLAAWGNGDRKAADGFGSCCNPMNIRFGPGGEVYTAEASVGSIKRFSPDGKFLGIVGKTTIVPGCKHVAIGMSPDASRVYMLDITRRHIVVMAQRK